MEKQIRVLVVDDSAVMRKLLSDVLEGAPEIEIVGTARNGIDAIEKVQSLNPDVVTMDIEMPEMDGLTSLQHIMAENPLPVIMVSALDKRQADITMKALDLGAVDFIPKTSGTVSLDIENTSATLISKVKTAAKIKVSKRKVIKMSPISYPKFKPKKGNWVITIGASTGGPKAIPEVLTRLPRDLPAMVLIVQHMPKAFTKSFAERLNWYTSLEVREAKEGDEISNGVALVAPGDLHMEVDEKKIHLTESAPVNNVRPSADVLMSGAAKNFGPKCIGVILTGMGSDGAEGMRDIKKHGGKTIAQNKETCVVYGMPKAAVNLRIIDTLAPLSQIGKSIINALEG
jgi:two-component system chemotaxis response regulator CheB